MPSRSSTKVHVARVLGVAVAYYCAAKLGLELAFATSSVTAIWPPTGIALAALVLWGYRIWPGVALGAFMANLWTGVPLYTVAGITVGNTLEALVGAFLLLAVAGFRPSLERVRDVLALVVQAGAVDVFEVGQVEHQARGGLRHPLPDALVECGGDGHVDLTRHVRDRNAVDILELEVGDRAHRVIVAQHERPRPRTLESRAHERLWRNW